MAKKLTSRERVLRTVRGESVDRVPVFAPVQWDPMWRITGTEPDWAAEPNYAATRELVEEHCDAIVGMAPGGLFDRRFLLIPGESVDPQPVERHGDRWRRVTLVRTPGGDLRTVEEWEEGVRTVWYPEPLLKDRQDVDRLLSVPCRFDPPDPSALEQVPRRLGERGVTEVHVSTPLVCVSRLFQFEQFLEWCAAEFDLVDTLIRTVQERIRERLTWVLEHGGGPLVWFGGSEQATPPMMSPRLYDALVVRYDRPLFDLVHAHGCLVHVHCHGKVSGILDRMREMGVDMTDPVEPPPQGDVEIGEAKGRVRGRMTLMGNIEFCDLEFAPPDRIEELVRTAVLDGGKEHFMLYPSATGIAGLSDRYRDNAIRYMETALECGRS